MPFVFIFIGLALVITAIEGTYNALGSQLKKDFTGKGGFQWWALAVALIGGLGYVESIRPVANKLLWLVIVGIFLANKGFWQNLVDAFNKGPINPTSSGSSVGGSTGSGLGNISAVITMGSPSGALPVNELKGIPDLSGWNSTIGF